MKEIKNDVLTPKIQNDNNSITIKNNSNLSDLYYDMFKFKNLVRSGWKMRNVPGRLESDAEHTFSMLVLGLQKIRNNNLNLDELKVMKMILFHDLGEIDCGDYTPFDNITKQDKFDKEYACIKRLSLEYDMPDIEKCWLEFEESKTPEAQFVKKLDKYDAVMQAKIYSEKLNSMDLYNEFRHTSKAICDEFDKLL